MRVVTVVGARPQLIKAAAVGRALAAAGMREHLVHTGQHYDDAMSERFFRELAIPAPQVNLGVGSGSHAAQTARMLAELEPILIEQKPDWVLTFGDTNSTLAAALAAAKLHLPQAHVEAGLRSHNRRMPEEVNRVVTDRLSECLLCPSDTAVTNLRNEGITHGVHLVGDVMADVVELVRPKLEELERDGPWGRLDRGGYFLATVHRAENTDDPERLAAIAAGLGRLPAPVVLPLHPRTRAAAARSGIAWGAQVRVVEPLGHLDVLRLVRHARAVLTDSGGLQKEAHWLGVPCVTLRDETEWVETVSAGWNRLVGADADAIVAAATTARTPAPGPRLYGDGHAAERCAAILAAGLSSDRS